MSKWTTMCTAGLVLAFAATAMANSIESSTMVFEGALTQQGSALVGTIGMTAGNYYVAGGGGEAISTAGGFDVYAKEGGTVYVEGMDPSSWTVGSDHDAYSESGPWGTWYDPDCADWNCYSLELTEDHWYLRYTSTQESPMSGTMDWVGMFAAETDLGTQERPDGYPPHGRTDNSGNYGGGACAWDWQNGWGVEVVPLELCGFDVEVEDLGSGNYRMTLTPAPEPATMALLGLGLLGLAVRKRR